MNRLEDLQDVLRHIDTERNQLREDEDIVKTKLQKISNVITSNLTPQFDNLHKSITSHKSLLNLFAERDQLSKLIEETSQEIKIKNLSTLAAICFMTFPLRLSRGKEPVTY